MLPIRISDDDLEARWIARMENKLQNWKPTAEIKQPPKDFTNWIDKNQERIENAKQLPYWYMNNYNMINFAVEKPKLIEAAKTYKATIPEGTGLSITGDNFVTGSILINRNSIKASLNHTNDNDVRKYLNGIQSKMKDWKYLGWQYTEEGRHTDTSYFTYYEFKISGKTYYANVKKSVLYNSEVLYCIIDKKPNFRTDKNP